MGQILNGGGNATINISDDTSLSVATSTSTFTIQSIKKVENVQFIENEEGNFMDITYSETSNFFVGTQPPRRLIKERYGVVGGKMRLIKTIRGEERPGYYVEPTVEWEE